MAPVNASLLRQIENTVADLRAADLNSFDQHIQKLSRALHANELERYTQILVQGLDLAACLPPNYATQRGGVLKWPSEHNQELGTKILLIDRMASKEGEALTIAATFYRGSGPLASLKNMVAQVIVPFMRDYIEYIKSHSGVGSTVASSSSSRLAPSPTALRVERRDAARRLEQRIELGRDLQNYSPGSDEEIESFDKGCDRWHEYNVDLLKQMFTTDDIAGEYANSIGGFYTQDVQGKVRLYKDGIRRGTVKLESIGARLELYPEPANTSDMIAVQSSFIAKGNQFDTLASFSKILSSATTDALIVDPYMDQIALTEFAVLLPEAVTIRLLSDSATVKPSLQPSVTKWKAQYATTRPLVARLAPPRALHDRLIIIDSKDAWVLTQSLNAFAQRSPASIVRVDPDTAQLKVEVYNNIFASASPLV
jgi:hypothetical protein